MKKDTIEDLASRLDDVAARDAVPAQQRALCARMRDHLLRPIRIVVTGLEGSGKSSLINMMLARQVIGLPSPVPIVDTVYGPTERVTCELEDGRSLSRPGVIADMAPPEGTARILQELPDATLRSQVYRELELGDGGEAGVRLLQSSLAEADFFIWCTTEFGTTEQALWASVPEALKGHSLAVLSGMDRLQARGALDEVVAQLSPVVAEEFVALYTVASTRGLAALNAAGGPDGPLWKSSGGLTLCRDIKRKIISGRAEDLDRARMMLARFEVEAETPAGAAKVGEPTAPTIVALPARASERAYSTVNEALSEAVGDLTRCGADLSREYEASRGMDDAIVLDRCITVVADLGAKLDAVAAACPELQGAQRDAVEAHDMLTLLQLERGEDAALDAVTLLLQLKKEMSSRLAA